MYCWLKPESSASCSWVKPFSCLIRLTFPPDQLAQRTELEYRNLLAKSGFRMDGVTATRSPFSPDCPVQWPVKQIAVPLVHAPAPYSDVP
jgi:hypothetical protein